MRKLTVVREGIDMVATTPVLGKGVYNLADAARYTHLHERRVRSWFAYRSDTRTGPLFHSDFPVEDGSHRISFLDLVDVRIAGQLRESGVSMQVIRSAYAILERDMKSDHPFAHSSIYTDGKRVFISAAIELGSAELSEVVTHQQFFPRVREFLTQIEYSEETRLAQRWFIAKGVTLDPSVSFGQPVVKGTGVTTFVLASSFHANQRNSALVAELFGVSTAAVEHAVDFEDRYGSRSAA